MTLLAIGAAKRSKEKKNSRRLNIVLKALQFNTKQVSLHKIGRQ